MLRIIINEIGIITNFGYNETSSAKTIDDGAKRGL